MGLVRCLIVQLVFMCSYNTCEPFTFCPCFPRVLLLFRDVCLPVASPGAYGECLKRSTFAPKAQSFGLLAVPDNVLRLAGGSDDPNGAFALLPFADYSAPCSSFGFNASFAFTLTTYAVNHGFTFAILVNQALGQGGNQLGYGGTGPGIAVEFDTVSDSWDPPSPHVGIDAGGSVVSLAVAEALMLTLKDSLFHRLGFYAWIEYSPQTQTLRVYLSQSPAKPDDPLLSQNLDFCSTVGLNAGAVLPALYVGFTGGSDSVNKGDTIIMDWVVTTGELKNPAL